MGYTIDQLAGKEAVLGSEVIPVHEGITNKAPVSLLDQGIVITEGGGTNTGIIRKNKSYVLMNDASDISLNLGEVLGKKKNPENNTYEDDAEAGAGITVTILNASARAHYVVSGSEGYKLEPTQSVQLLWSGSKFVKLLPEFLNDYPKTTDIEANYYNKQSVDYQLNKTVKLINRSFCVASGIITGSAKTINLSLHLPKKLHDYNISITSLQGRLRGHEGYIHNGADIQFISNEFNVSVAKIYESEILITITKKNDTVWTNYNGGNVLNNTNVTLNVTAFNFTVTD